MYTVFSILEDTLKRIFQVDILCTSPPLYIYTYIYIYCIFLYILRVLQVKIVKYIQDDENGEYHKSSRND